MSKISHWIVMRGIPDVILRTRAGVRHRIKGLRKSPLLEPKRYFYYVGKVIPDPKRRGHGKIVLEY